MSFKVSRIVNEQGLELEFQGELDMYSIKTLDSCKNDLGNSTNIVINLEKLEFIDSTGIKGLLTFLESLTQQNKSFKVKNIKPEINEVFELLDIYELIGRDMFEL